MDQLATFYPAFEVESRSTDTIFRELCQPADYKKLDEGRWKEALVNRYGEMMAAAPNIRKLAARLINEGLKAKGHAGVDAERTYFNTFTDGYKNSGDSFYRHNTAQLKESYSLVDAAIFDIFTQDWYHTWNDLGSDRTNGIYSVGKNGQEWGPSNKLPFSSKVIADILYYDKSVINSYYDEFAPFWNKYASQYRDFLADSFLASALVQYRAQLLTDEAFCVLRNFYYGNYPVGCKVIKLDVYTYCASDIICIYLGAERMILYIPGASMPFREFVSLKEMKAWIAEQIRMPENRDALARHFSLWHRSDGTTVGVNRALRYMAEGHQDWPVQTYIINREQTYDLKKDVFGAIRDWVKERTESDQGYKLSATDSRYRDYVLVFAEFFLSQVQMVGMILPEVSVLFDMDASRTPLGLLSAWVVDPYKLAEQHQCKGSRVDTDAFRGLELLRICNQMSEGLKNFSRPADKIPAFASERQAITTRFGLTQEQQEALRLGDEPKLPLEGQPAHIRLVRLSNDTQPLAVVGTYAGNQWQLLDTLTLIPVKGQLVSAVADAEAGKTLYTANGYFRGYLPFQPYRFAFEYVWTPARFQSSLGTPVSPIPDVIHLVDDCLKRIHTAVTLRKGQEAALELMQAVGAYTLAPARNLPYREPLSIVMMQVGQAFFPEGMELFQKSLLAELPVVGAQAAAYLYEAGIEEMAGENQELTETLLRYARYDNLVPLHGSGFKGAYTEIAAYPPFYIVENLDDFNALPTRYFEQEPYRSEGLKDNKSVLRTAIDEIERKGLVEGCFIYDEKLYIGCPYVAWVHVLSEASCNSNSPFSVRPLTALRMLQELSGNADDPGAGLFSKYALPKYYRKVADLRMKTMWEVYHLTENFDFSAWDAAYGESFGLSFAAQEGETTEQAVPRQIGLLLQGKGCALPANVGGVGFFLDHLQAFLDAGVTCVGVTSLYNDMVEEDLRDHIAEGFMTDRLNATLLTLDEGQADGPFRRLLAAARTKGFSLLPLGQADGSVAEESNGYTHLYFRGATLLHALNRLPRTGKVVLFTHQYMMFSTPGINAPLPGLTQCLHMPGAWVDDAGELRYYAESSGRGVLSDVEKWQEVEGEMLPVEEDRADLADDLVHLMPEDGKVLGLKAFSYFEIEPPTPAGREALLKKTVSEADWPALKEQVDAIKEAMSGWVTQEATTGSEQGVEVNRQLEILEYLPGNGATLTWWVRGQDDKFYSPYFHTVPTVLIGGNEYVVDVAHLQFLYAQDEGVIVLPVEEWAQEICARAFALHPYLVYSLKTESELKLYNPFPFTSPRVPE